MLAIGLESRATIVGGIAYSLVSGRRTGNRITSRIERCPVNNITKRSMPMPSPPAGGMA
ncbi:hypothetical protein Rcae01_04300 [Novipirellula caenicola]|uniref:Uncharacterized protein n=1 Tax=Novipirellula caenicola TaxID=1536901 RepID=A0ABP9VUM4_9BACT